jgi:hypothetical protein
MFVRAIISWIAFTIKLAMWGGIVALIFWVTQRGTDGFVQDVQGISDHWRGEYRKYSQGAEFLRGFANGGGQRQQPLFGNRNNRGWGR